MKRAGLLVCLTVIMVMMASVMVFAEGGQLKIVSTYPEDGQKNTTKENMCVKLQFSEEMGDGEATKIDNKFFTITDNKGKKVPIKVLNNPKNRHEVMVLADTDKTLDIKDDTKYTLTVSDKLTDVKGGTLAKPVKISFTTQNQKQNTWIQMGMTVLMFGGIFIFMARSAKKHAEADDEDSREKDLKINPYKEAKRTGKSVEEIVEKVEKEKAKRAKKEAKKAAERAAEIEDEDEELPYGHYKVSKARPISEGGGTYITGRKAAAEAEAARQAKWDKNSKKKGKRK